MHRAIIFVLLSTAIWVVDSTSPVVYPTTPVVKPKTCADPNEVYSDCGGCDGTCDNPDPICNRMCHVGCFCKPGMVRDRSGKCILKRNCPIVCGKNEVPTKCLPSQEPSCKNRRAVKPKVCVPGCICAPGYIRCSMCGCGSCVKIEDCHEPYI